MNFMGKKNGKVGTRSKWALKSKLKSLNFILVTMGSPWGFLSKVCILPKATWSLSDSLSSSVCDSLGNVIVIKKKKPLKDILSLSSLVIFHANQISESVLCVCVPRFSRVWLFATLWTVAHQAPLSIGFPRQKYWSGLPLPSPGDLPDLETEPGSPAWLADSLPSELLGIGV